METPEFGFCQISSPDDCTPLRVSATLHCPEQPKAPPSVVPGGPTTALDPLMSPQFSATSTISPLTSETSPASGSEKVVWNEKIKCQEHPLAHGPVQVKTALVDGPITVRSDGDSTTTLGTLDEHIVSWGTPLPFPDYPPPEGQSHMPGRCIQLPGEGTKWVSCKPPGVGEDSWKLPGNVPMHDIHWCNRLLPGTLTKPRDWNHFGEAVSRECTTRGSSPTVPPDTDDSSKLSLGHCKTP